jgi:nucleoside-diphosphate-sugar epimerase
MNNALDVRDGDLAYICAALRDDFRRLEGAKLAITGGAGFLGYYLVQAILEWNRHHTPKPADVYVLDNFRRGVPAWLADLGQAANLHWITHDVIAPLPLSLPSFDFVIHAAGIASPALYRQIPIETMDANVGGLRRFLDAAVQWTKGGSAVSGFLFYSSSEIYGDPDPASIPTPEGYRGNVSCTGPRACYDESKRFGETLAVNFARVHGVPVTIARPFNNYGPGMKINDGRVIADFCRAVIEGRDIVMHSDGSPTRTFCYAADAVVGYYKVLLRGKPGEAYNIGTDAPEISIRDLASLVMKIGADVFGYDGSLVIRESPEADYLIDNPSRRCPDLTRARRDLGYRPQIELEEGIRRTLLWYSENREVVGE